MSAVIYDIESYPNYFCLTACDDDGGQWRYFEISDRVNHCRELCEWLRWLASNGWSMVGYKNIHYDWPVVNELLQHDHMTAEWVYNKSQAIFDAQNDWEHVVRSPFVTQIDLFKIHGFDNPAKRTSLKALEFYMRMFNIEDLPYAPGTVLTHEQMNHLGSYCHNDVLATLEFYKLSSEEIKFRLSLVAEFSEPKFLNYSDVKIGVEFFIRKLNERGFNTAGKTTRPVIHLREAVLRYIRFQHPEFERVRQYFLNQTVTETKGVFKDLIANVGGLEFKFGMGGIHASVNCKKYEATGRRSIIDKDVTSYYPSLAIVNKITPAHLSEGFPEVYAELFEQRTRAPKKTHARLNKMLKLALNAVFGNMNNPYSPLYDPLAAMTITITGQFLLCMLAERLLKIRTLEIIQVNTDGLTYIVDNVDIDRAERICSEWEDLTKLHLEEARYSRMWVRDVNNYLAEYEHGDLKAKGAYSYEPEYHQDPGALVVPKAAQAALANGADISEFIHNHPDFLDFALRAKIPRSSRLVAGDRQLQNLTRYYITTDGDELFKIMPPLASKPGSGERRFAIQKGWLCRPCNDVMDARTPINKDWYIKETEKLVIT